MFYFSNCYIKITLVIYLIVLLISCSGIKDSSIVIIKKFDVNDEYCVSKDGKLIATASKRALKIWTKEGQNIKTFRWQPEHILKLSFSDNGNLIFVQGIRGLKVYDLQENLIYENKASRWFDIYRHQLVTSSDTFYHDNKLTKYETLIKIHTVDSLTNTINYKDKFHANRNVFFFDIEDDEILLCYNTSSDSLKALTQHNLEVRDFKGKIISSFKSHRKISYITDNYLIDFSPDKKSIFIASQYKSEFSKLYTKEGDLLSFFDKSNFVTFSEDGEYLILEGAIPRITITSFGGIMVKDVYGDKLCHFLEDKYIRNVQYSHTENAIYFYSRDKLYFLNLESCISSSEPIIQTITKDDTEKNIVEPEIKKSESKIKNSGNKLGKLFIYLGITFAVLGVFFLLRNLKTSSKLDSEQSDSDVIVAETNVAKNLDTKEKYKFQKEVNRIRKSIELGNIDVALKSLSKLTTKIKRCDIDSINLSSRYADLAKKVRNGIISTDAELLERNKIINAMLEILKIIENK